MQTKGERQEMQKQNASIHQIKYENGTSKEGKTTSGIKENRW